LQDIDPRWRNTDLKHGLRMFAKVIRGYASKRRTKISQRRKDSVRIGWVGANPYIQILGSAWLGMKTYSVSTDNEVFNSMFVECA